MDKEQFRQWIYDNYNVPADNCTMAPSMLDAILDYAEGMGSYEQQSYLHTMFPQIQRDFGPDCDVIAKVRY